MPRDRSDIEKPEPHEGGETWGSDLIAEMLRDLGAKVAYSDPHVPSFPKMRAHSFDLSSVALTADNLSKFDCVLLATDHDKFDYELLRARAPLLVDCRGKFLQPADNIIRA